MTTTMIIGLRRLRSHMSCESDSRTAFLMTWWSVAPSLAVFARVLARRARPSSSDGVLFGAEDDASHDEFGLAHRLAGLAVDGDDDGRDAVAREQLPVAQHDLPDLAHRQPVDVDDARLDVLGDARAVLVDLEAVAVVDHEDVFALDARGFGEASMRLEMARLAVDRAGSTAA